MTRKYSYLTCCVESDGQSITEMVDEATGISYRTFTRQCDWQPWAKTLGYQVGPGPELHLATDWHVHYFRSVYQGKPCFYAKHSSIEHIFTIQNEPAPIRRPW